MSLHVLHSPNGRVNVTITLDAGSLYYEVSRDGTVASARSPLGILTDRCDFTSGLTLSHEQRGVIDETYTIAAFKKAACRDHAHTLTLRLDKCGHGLLVEARAYDDGAAVRLIVPSDGPGKVLDEATAFTLPEDARSFYAQRLLFSYEDHYHPVPLEDLPQNPYAFPALVELVHGLWALYAEAAVFGGYGGGNLRSRPEAPSQLRVLRAPDQHGPVETAGTVRTPWRVVLLGSLNDIVTSNTLENLNPPSIVEDTSFIRPGISAWSWMVENNSTTNTKRIYEYVDYAAEMGFPYYLADGGWPGHVDIPALVRYARSKGVDIWLWEHSGDMRDPAEAEEKMRLWKSWGVVGLKIDFFESDRPARVAQYDMLAALGAKYLLMLNFHGATKPAGESRTWPHVMTREGVMGGEYLQNYSSYLPGGPDAAHHCTLPFTRNAVGPMDYTPVLYNTYLTGTSDSHQTALAVIFLSYIQHIGESAENVLRNAARPFLASVPASWDEGKLLEGHPAAYVTMARRKGEDWFVGGICARRARSATVDLSFLAEGDYEATLYRDDLGDLTPFDVPAGALGPIDQAWCERIDAHRQRPTAHQHDVHRTAVEKLTVHSGQVLSIPMCVGGGFAMHLAKR